MTKHKATVRFEAPVSTIESEAVVILPKAQSARLPSRGQVAVTGTFNGVAFRTVLEPDGVAGHWMRIPEVLAREADMGSTATAKLEMVVAADWPEPVVPQDLASALTRAPSTIRDLWADITPMARWEWVRWVNATSNPATRDRRVEVSISKMEAGKRRPCCFNLAACTDPDLSKGGKLRSPRNSTA